MPWPLIDRPSIQLGALKAYLARHEPRVTVRCHHPYLGVAETLGVELYRFIASDLWLSETLYAGLLFPECAEGQRAVARRRLRKAPGDPDPAEVVESLHGHLERFVAQPHWEETRLVGFSVCFHQLFSTLAAARRLKRRWPHLAVVLGGSACTGRVGRELLTRFPEVDFLVTGEGERSLLGLCRNLAGKTPDLPGGVMTREGEGGGACEEIDDLAELPLPDYRDFFAELSEGLGARMPLKVVLPVEFSRGCAWRKCRFCNLNLQWRGCRSKSASQVAEEVMELARRHLCLDFTFTDNLLPPAEAERFFAEISRSGKDLRFFAEIRAGISLRRLKGFRAGGLATVQAGIEALSNSLLARMGKGTTVMDNVLLMRNALEAGVELKGNLIVEFPGSTDQEAAETAAALDVLICFPPLDIATFFLGFGSPMAADPAAFGIRRTPPHRTAQRIMPRDLARCHPFLILGHEGDRSAQRARWREVRRKVAAWQRLYRGRKSTPFDPPPLSFRDGGDFLVIRQELPGGSVLHHRLRGRSREIYLALRQPLDLDRLLARFPGGTRESFVRFLEELTRKRLLFQDQGKWLALAVPWW